MKSIWNGSIGFGLVNIPIRLYLAVREREIPLHTLCKNGHRIIYKRWCPEEDREVSWQEIKKGFEISKDKFVVLEKEDLEKIKIPSTKTIEIKAFTNEQIDPIYFDKSYYAVPDKNGERAYSLLFQALALENKAGIGKFTFKDKEHVVVLRAYKKLILVQTLHYAEEIISIDNLAEVEKLPKPDKKELELAQMLINKLSREEFDLSSFKDEYAEALKKLIEAKATGKSYEIKAEKETKKAKSLIESLTESLKEK
jgi:DNA end-binding protein Ku